LRTGIDQPAFRAVQRSIGFDVTEAAWSTLAAHLVGASMVIAETTRDREPVAVAAAERRDGGWVELGWVAVAPAHRGRRLGLSVCSLLTRSLIDAGETRLFGSTQDDRLAALAIYFTLGYVPVFRPEKLDRWRRVCNALGVPFSPPGWGWPERAS